MSLAAAAEVTRTAPFSGLTSPKRPFTVSDSSPFVLQRKKSRSSPYFFSPRERADSSLTNSSITHVYDWSPGSANADIMFSPVIGNGAHRKTLPNSTETYNKNLVRSRENSFSAVQDSPEDEIPTPILKDAIDELDMLHEVSFGSNTDTSPERIKSLVPTFESIVDENLRDDPIDVDHPHFLPPNTDEHLSLPQIRPIIARKENNALVDTQVCPTPTAFLAQLRI